MTTTESMDFGAAPPGQREQEVDSRADEIGCRPKLLLHLLAEHQARRVAWNAREWHHMLHPDPDNGFVDPDDYSPASPPIKPARTVNAWSGVPGLDDAA
jgi:hypothetical protein